MAATRREGQRGQNGPGSKALTALVLIAIPGAAALGALLDGTPTWIVAFAAASIASMVALASIARWSMPRDTEDAAARGDADIAVAPVRSTASEEVLRRATEVRCAERTAILENLSDAVVLVDAHGETRFANLAARRMLGEQAAVAGTRAAIDALPPQVLRAVQGVAAATAGERRRIECELRDANATPVVIGVTGVREGAEGLANFPDSMIDAVVESAEECPGECIFIEP